MRTRVLLVVVGLALVAAACNNPTYSRNTVERDLRDQSGLTATEAQCVTMRLEDTIGVERLGARDEPTTREREKLHAALVFAGLACGARPYDAEAAATVLRDKARMPATYADCMARAFGDKTAGSLPDPADAFKASHLQTLQIAIVDSTVPCARARGANVELELRRNLGVSRQQSACILQGSTPGRAFVGCTTTTTTTTTTTATTATTTTLVPSPTTTTP